MNVISHAVVCWGAKTLMWCKDCPAEYLFKCHQKSALAVQDVAVIHSSDSRGHFQTSCSLGRLCAEPLWPGGGQQQASQSSSA